MKAIILIVSICLSLGMTMNATASPIPIVVDINKKNISYKDVISCSFTLPGGSIAMVFHTDSENRQGINMENITDHNYAVILEAKKHETGETHSIFGKEEAKGQVYMSEGKITMRVNIDQFSYLVIKGFDTHNPMVSYHVAETRRTLDYPFNCITLKKHN